MIETVTNARSVFPLPAPSCSSSSTSARLPVPVPEDDFRWNVYYPHPPSEDCSSQRSVPGGGDQQYKRRLRRALHKSRSRDHIDDVDVPRRHGAHTGSFFWGEFEAPKYEYPPPQRQPLYQQPHHVVDSFMENAWTPGNCGGGWAGVRTGCDVSEATMTSSGCRVNGGRGGGEEEDEEEEEANFVSPPKIAPFSGRIITVGKLF